MIISEKSRVHIKKYPYAEKLNPILHQIIKQEASCLDKGALMTSWECMDKKEFKIISDYAYNLIMSFETSLYCAPARCECRLILQQLWGQLYNKDHHQALHHHVPSHWSFVYFVNTPKGSSPLVFTQSGKKVKAESGKMVIFPGSIYHHVPENKCEGRSVIAGNIYYKINDAF